MSLQMLRSLFESLPSLTQLELYLLRFKNEPKNGMTYCSRAIKLQPANLMGELLEDIKEEYVGSKDRLGQYATVEPYDGSVIGTTVYSFDCTNELLKTPYDNLITSLANPQTETDPFTFQANAYILQGMWTHEGSPIPVKLIIVSSPFKPLKHKFFYDNGTFTKASHDVLDLRLYADVVAIGQEFFFFGMAGEKLFGMERAYRANSIKLAESLSSKSFFANTETLQTTATSGHYPRMLVSYQPDKLEYLKEPVHRRAIAEKFKIAILENEILDLGTAESAGNLIRFLCNKGMLDPVDQSAMEVAGAKRWAS